MQDTDYSVKGVAWNSSNKSLSVGDKYAINTVSVNNPLMFTTQEEIMENLKTNLIGLAFDSVTIKKQGTGMFQLGDLIDYKVADDKTYRMLIMGISYEFNNGFFFETLYSMAESASQQRNQGNKTGFDFPTFEFPEFEPPEQPETPVYGSLVPITSYEYLSDTSVSVNDITYTILKNDTGLISKVFDNYGGELRPNFSGEITDIALHNSVIWATVLARGLQHEDDGLNVIFTPDSFDVANNRWYNTTYSQYFTTVNAIKSGNAISFGTNAYGCINTDIPIIAYVIVKLNQFVSHLSFGGVMSKRLIKNDNPPATYDLLGTIRNNMLCPYFSGGLVAENNFLNYAVFCFQYKEHDIYFYVNGVLVGHHFSIRGIADDYYGEYLLNRQIRGSTIDTINPCGSTFKLIAFGTKNHTDEQVRINSERFRKQYLGGD